MTGDPLALALPLLVALCAGGAIGLERSYHGRPAGFRTHALVCLASALLMAATQQPQAWLGALATDSARMDPLRMAQGIMTGVGFIGAGVVFREGMSVRGLTTASSIWVTAGIGIVAGVGLYLLTLIVTVLTLGILSAFLWIEVRLPSHLYAQHSIRFVRKDAMSEDEVRALLARVGFTVLSMNYHITDDGLFLDYRMTVRTSRTARLSALAATLLAQEKVHSFRLSPTGN